MRVVAVKRKKPEADFEVYFDGNGVFPEDIAFTTLSDTMSAVQRLVASPADLDEPPELTVRLLDVRRGSAVFRCVTDDAALASANLRVVGKMLSRKELDEDSIFAFEPLSNLSRVARKLKCTIVIRSSDGHGRAIARIGPDTYKDISLTALSSGDTSVMAYVARVGGATEPRCVLRIPDRNKVLFCQVTSESLAQELAKCLYEHVLVSGKATWLRGSLQLVSLTVTGFTRVRSGTIRSTMRAMRSAGGKVWDKVEDPGRYLEGVTGSS